MCQGLGPKRNTMKFRKSTVGGHGAALRAPAGAEPPVQEHRPVKKKYICI